MTIPSKLATCITHQNNLETLHSHCFWHFTCQCYQYSRESSTAPASPVESPSANRATTTRERPKHYHKKRASKALGILSTCVFPCFSPVLAKRHIKSQDTFGCHQHPLHPTLSSASLEALGTSGSGQQESRTQWRQLLQA